MIRIVLFALLVAVILAVVGLVDCALLPRTQVRTLPKPLWFLVIVLVPIVGPVLWFVAGRPRSGTARAGQASPSDPSPDDDPVFLRGLDAQARVLRIEEELARLEDEEKRGGRSAGDDAADGRGGA